MHLKLLFGNGGHFVYGGYELRSDVPICEGVVGIGKWRLTNWYLVIYCKYWPSAYLFLSCSEIILTICYVHPKRNYDGKFTCLEHIMYQTERCFAH